MPRAPTPQGKVKWQGSVGINKGAAALPCPAAGCAAPQFCWRQRPGNQHRSWESQDGGVVLRANLQACGKGESRLMDVQAALMYENTPAPSFREMLEPVGWQRGGGTAQRQQVLTQSGCTALALINSKISRSFTEDLPKRTGYIINNNNFFSLHPRINYRVRFSLLFFTMTVNKQSSLQKLLAFETLLLICSTARAVPSQSH